MDTRALLAAFGVHDSALPERITRVIIDVGWMFSTLVGEIHESSNTLLLGFEASPFNYRSPPQPLEYGPRMRCGAENYFVLGPDGENVVRWNGCLAVIPVAITEDHGSEVEIVSSAGFSGCDSVLASPELDSYEEYDEALLSLAFQRCGYLANLGYDLKFFSGPNPEALCNGGSGYSEEFLLNGTFFLLNVLIKCLEARAAPGRRVFRVPGVSLEEVIRALPAGMPVHLVKTDVQGVDLSVFRSVKSQAHRVAKVQMEVQDVPSGDPTSLYHGHGDFDEMLHTMAALGFALAGCEIGNCALMEYDCFFENRHQPGLPMGELAPGFLGSQFRNAVIAEAVEPLSSSRCLVRGVSITHQAVQSEDLCEYYRRDPFGILRRLLESEPWPEAGIAVDLGAGDGRDAVLLAKLAPALEVFAFEANDTLRALLQRNRDANKAYNLHIADLDWSQSERCGQFRPWDCKRHEEEGPENSPHWPSFVQWVEDFLAWRGNLTLLKLDCDGCEKWLRESEFWSIVGRAKLVTGRWTSAYHIYDGRLAVESSTFLSRAALDDFLNYSMDESRIDFDELPQNQIQFS